MKTCFLRLGVKAVDEMGKKGTTGARLSSRCPQCLGSPHSLHTSLPSRFRHGGGVRCVVHSVHNHYHHNHFHIYKETNPPQAQANRRHVITKERT